MRDGHLASELVPQADTIDTVFQVVDLVSRRVDIVPKLLGFDTPRQVAYYTNAARALGLVDDQHELTSAGRLMASLRGAERLALAAVQFEKSRCGLAWARWSRKALGDVAPESAERFLLATTDLELSTARRRAHTLSSWLERFQREAETEWRRRRAAPVDPPAPQRRTAPARRPAQDSDDQPWDDEAAKGALRLLVGMPLKLEGERKLLVHFRHERNPELRRLFLSECERNGRLRCQGCGISPDERYGKEFSRVLEVHHLLRLGLGVRETKLDDLALLCPTCHRVVHHRREEPMNVAELRVLLGRRQVRPRKPTTP